MTINIEDNEGRVVSRHYLIGARERAHKAATAHQLRADARAKARYHSSGWGKLSYKARPRWYGYVVLETSR